VSEAVSVLLICWQNRIHEGADGETPSFWTFVCCLLHIPPSIWVPYWKCRAWRYHYRLKTCLEWSGHLCSQNVFYRVQTWLLLVNGGHTRSEGNLFSMYVVFRHENLVTIWPGGIGERKIFLKSNAIRN